MFGFGNDLYIYIYIKCTLETCTKMLWTKQFSSQEAIKTEMCALKLCGW